MVNVLKNLPFRILERKKFTIQNLGPDEKISRNAEKIKEIGKNECKNEKSPAAGFEKPNTFNNSYLCQNRPKGGDFFRVKKLPLVKK